MKSKLIAHYVSEEKRFEQLTGYKPYYSLFEKFLAEHQGEAVIILLQDGQHIPVILISGSSKILAVRRFSEFGRLIIPSRAIVGVATP